MPKTVKLKRGAKRKERNLIREMTIAVKVTSEEHNLLTQKAIKEGLTVSASVRRSAIAYARLPAHSNADG